MTEHPPLPDGAVSWLDYAVACLPTRQLDIEYVLKDRLRSDGTHWRRNDFTAAARAELADLRERAGAFDAWVMLDEQKRLHPTCYPKWSNMRPDVPTAGKP